MNWGRFINRIFRRYKPYRSMISNIAFRSTTDLKPEFYCGTIYKPIGYKVSRNHVYYNFVCVSSAGTFRIITNEMVDTFLEVIEIDARPE